MLSINQHSDPPGTRTLMNMIRESKEPITPNTGDELKRLPDLINRHMGKASFSTDALAELAGLNRSSLYRILSGQRRPGRDVLIALAFPLKLTHTDTQELLKTARLAQLSPRDQRDADLLFAITHGYSLGEADDLLSNVDTIATHERIGLHFVATLATHAAASHDKLASSTKRPLRALEKRRRWI